MRARDPNVNLNPISKDDLDGIKQSMDRATIPQKITFISQLIQQAPKNEYGQKLVELTLKQVGQENNSYLLASQFLAHNLNYKGVPVAKGILQGEKLIKDRNVIIPTMLEAETRSRIGTLAQEGDFNATFNAVSNMYALYANQRGVTHDKKDVQMNEEALNDAINAVTGGVYTQKKEGIFGWGTRNAGFTLKDNDIDSWQVEKPYGWSDAKFESRLEESYKTVSFNTGISVKDLKENYRLKVRDNTNLDSVTIYDLLDSNGEKINIKDKNGNGVNHFLRVYGK